MNEKVFINCPYDDEYKPKLFCLIYFLYKINMIPLLASDNSDSTELRITKITNLIKESQIGFHDISRMVSSKKKELYRLNMAFELGMDYAYKYFFDESKDKEILIFDCDKYRYKKSLSDISGMDIKCYADNIEQLFGVLRDWIISKYGLMEIKSAVALKYEYEDFQTWLCEKLRKKGFSVIKSRGFNKSSNTYSTIYSNYIKQISPKEFGNYCKDYFKKNMEKTIKLN